MTRLIEIPLGFAPLAPTYRCCHGSHLIRTRTLFDASALFSDQHLNKA
ncbi:hypothetical protein [Thioalkalivibrio thiocyanodenitrificans]|nr:hypothetical protein [Thioalkalivibrio thiocyanodenitrificans]